MDELRRNKEEKKAFPPTTGKKEPQPQKTPPKTDAKVAAPKAGTTKETPPKKILKRTTPATTKPDHSTVRAEYGDSVAPEVNDLPPAKLFSDDPKDTDASSPVGGDSYDRDVDADILEMQALLDKQMQDVLLGENDPSSEKRAAKTMVVTARRVGPLVADRATGVTQEGLPAGGRASTTIAMWNGKGPAEAAVPLAVVSDRQTTSQVEDRPGESWGEAAAAADSQTMPAGIDGPRGSGGAALKGGDGIAVPSFLVAEHDATAPAARQDADSAPRRRGSCLAEGGIAVGSGGLTDGQEMVGVRRAVERSSRCGRQAPKSRRHSSVKLKLKRYPTAGRWAAAVHQFHTKHQHHHPTSPTVAAGDMESSFSGTVPNCVSYGKSVPPGSLFDPPGGATPSKATISALTVHDRGSEEAQCAIAKTEVISRRRPFVKGAVGNVTDSYNTSVDALFLMDTGSELDCCSREYYEKVLAPLFPDIKEEVVNVRVSGVADGQQDTKVGVYLPVSLAGRYLGVFPFVLLPQMKDPKMLLGVGFQEKTNTTIMLRRGRPPRVFLGEVEVPAGYISGGVVELDEKGSYSVMAKKEVTLLPGEVTSVKVALTHSCGADTSWNKEHVSLTLDRGLEEDGVEVVGVAALDKRGEASVSLLLTGEDPVEVLQGMEMGELERVKDLEMDMDWVNEAEAEVKTITESDNQMATGCICQDKGFKIILGNERGMTLLGSAYENLNMFKEGSRSRPGWWLKDRATAVLSPLPRRGWAWTSVPALERLVRKAGWHGQPTVRVYYLDAAQLSGETARMLANLSQVVTPQLRLRKCPGYGEDGLVCMACKESCLSYTLYRHISCNQKRLRLLVLNGPAVLPHSWETVLDGVPRNLFRVGSARVEERRQGWRDALLTVHIQDIHRTNGAQINYTLRLLLPQLKYLYPQARVSVYSTVGGESLSAHTLMEMLEAAKQELKDTQEYRNEMAMVNTNLPKAATTSLVSLRLADCGCGYCTQTGGDGGEPKLLEEWSEWPGRSLEEVLEGERLEMEDLKVRLREDERHRRDRQEAMMHAVVGHAERLRGTRAPTEEVRVAAAEATAVGPTSAGTDGEEPEPTACDPDGIMTKQIGERLFLDWEARLLAGTANTEDEPTEEERFQREQEFVSARLFRPPSGLPDQDSPLLKESPVIPPAEELKEHLGQTSEDPEAFMKRVEGLREKFDIPEEEYLDHYDISQNRPEDHPFVRTLLRRFGKTVFSWDKRDRAVIRNELAILRVRKGIELPFQRAIRLSASSIRLVIRFLQTLEDNFYITKQENPLACCSCMVLFRNGAARQQFNELCSKPLPPSFQERERLFSQIPVRLVLTLQDINRCFVPENLAHSTVLLESTMSILSQLRQNSTMVSLVDQKRAFESIILHPESMRYCSFTVHRVGGFFSPTHLPLGGRSSPSILMKILYKIFSKDPRLMALVFVYMDDLLITSPSDSRRLRVTRKALKQIPYLRESGDSIEAWDPAEGLDDGTDGGMCEPGPEVSDLVEAQMHFECLFSMLKLCEEKGIMASAAKCGLMVRDRKIRILGSIVDRHGIHICSKRREELLAQSRFPPTRSDLQRVLGCLSFIRSFLKDGAALLSILFDLIDQKRPYRPEKIHELAYRCILRRVADSPSIHFIRPDLPVHVSTDASFLFYSSCYYQITETGSLAILGHGGGKFRPSETRASSVAELELLGLCRALVTLDSMLCSNTQEVILHTDSQSVFLLSQGAYVQKAGRLARLLVAIMQRNPRFVVIDWVSSDKPQGRYADVISRGLFSPMHRTGKHSGDWKSKKLAEIDTSAIPVPKHLMDRNGEIHGGALLKYIQEKIYPEGVPTGDSTDDGQIVGLEENEEMRKGETMEIFEVAQLEAFPLHTPLRGMVSLQGFHPEANGAETGIVATLEGVGDKNLKLVADLDVRQIVAAQDSHPELARLKQAIREFGEGTRKRLAKKARKFSIGYGNVLLWASGESGKIVLDLETAVRVLALLHLKFHQGENTLARQFSRHFKMWGTGLSRYLRAITRSCLVCQSERARSLPNKLSPGRLKLSLGVQQSLGLDHGFLQTTTVGNRMYVGFVISVCHFSRYVHASKVTRVDAATTIRFLARIFKETGIIPQMVRSDQGKALLGSSKVKEFLEEMGVKEQRMSLAYTSHVYNTESMVGQLKRMVRRLCLSSGKSWPEHFDQAVDLLNLKLRRYPVYVEAKGAKGRAGKKAHFGSVLLTPVDIMEISTRGSEDHNTRLVRGIDDKKWAGLRKAALERIKAANKEMNRRLVVENSERIKTTPFKVGQFALLKAAVRDKNNPEAAEYENVVYIISHVLGHQITLTPLVGSKNVQVVHSSRVKRFHVAEDVVQHLPKDVASKFAHKELDPVKRLHVVARSKKEEAQEHIEGAVGRWIRERWNKPDLGRAFYPEREDDSEDGEADNPADPSSLAPPPPTPPPPQQVPSPPASGASTPRSSGASSPLSDGPHFDLAGFLQQIGQGSPVRMRGRGLFESGSSSDEEEARPERMQQATVLRPPAAEEQITPQGQATNIPSVGPKRLFPTSPAPKSTTAERVRRRVDEALRIYAGEEAAEEEVAGPPLRRGARDRKAPARYSPEPFQRKQAGGRGGKARGKQTGRPTGGRERLPPPNRPVPRYIQSPPPAAAAGARPKTTASRPNVEGAGRVPPPPPMEGLTPEQRMHPETPLDNSPVTRELLDEVQMSINKMRREARNNLEEDQADPIAGRALAWADRLESAYKIEEEAFERDGRLAATSTPIRLSDSPARALRRMIQLIDQQLAGLETVKKRSGRKKQ